MLYNEAAGQIWLAYRSQHLQFSAFVEGFAAADKKGDGQKIRRLFLTTLGRDPTSREASMANKLIRSSPDRSKGYQDLLWSLLNSNEFILIL